MKNALKKINNVYLWAGLLAALSFCLIYGVNVLNPLNVGWFYSHHNDIAQQYLGWNAYRHTPWTFPWGNFNNLSYPMDISIVFMDSVPGVSFFFKLLAPILPNHFQYIGAWALFSYIMQALITAKILSHYTDNKLFMIFGSVLFLFVPVLIYRIFRHSSLTPQWIILFALEPLINYKAYVNNTRKFVLHFSFIAFFSACVHLYYAPMCAMMLFGFIVSDLIYEKNWRRPLITVAAYGVITIGITALLGGFTPGFENAGAGLEKLGINLNSFVNPVEDWSAILKDLPYYDRGQLRGFYLGLGCILLILIAVFVLLENSDLKALIKNNRFGITALGICFVCSFLMALLPMVSLGEKVLFQLPLSPAIYEFWSIFRAHGRFAWACIYMVLLLSAIVLSRFTRKKLAVAVMAVCLILQLVDLSPKLIEKHNEWAPYENRENGLEISPFWSKVSDNENIKHFVFSSLNNRVKNPIFFNVAEWAINHDKTTNDFYFARFLDMVIFEKNLRDSLADTEGNIYLFSKTDALDLMPEDINYYLQDGYIIGTKYDIEGFTPMSRAEVAEVIASDKAEELW